MNFIEANISAYQNYFNFQGRAQRSAFWWWQLSYLAISIAITFAEGGFETQLASGSLWDVLGGPFSTLWTLANFFPNLSVSVRRMHDMDRSGWWLLLSFIPIVGSLVMLVWQCKPGTAGANRFGPDPLTVDRVEAFS